MMSSTEYVLRDMCKSTGSPADRKSTALALRLARAEGMYPAVLAHALARRAEWLTWRTLTQREWQTTVSRRPQRGRHHDSWTIRERYMRASR